MRSSTARLSNKKAGDCSPAFVVDGLSLGNVDEAVAGDGRAAASRGRDVDAGDLAGFKIVDRGADLREVQTLRPRHFADDVAFIEDVASRRDFLDAGHHDTADVVGDAVLL